MKPRRPGICRTLLPVGAILLVVAPVAASDVLSIFDAHLHDNEAAAGIYPVAEVLKRFHDNGVTAILANSRPNEGRLHALCDEAALEIPFGHDPGAKITWAHTGFTTPPAKIASGNARRLFAAALER